MVLNSSNKQGQPCNMCRGLHMQMLHDIALYMLANQIRNGLLPTPSPSYPAQP